MSYHPTAQPERLSAQQLDRGEVQRWLLETRKPHDCRNVSLSLWKEHGVYHLRAHDFALHGRIFWSRHRTLTEARKAWSEGKRTVKAKIRREGLK